MSEQAIVLNELTKHYGKHRGIKAVHLSSVWTVTPRPASLPRMWAICPARTAITKT